MTTRFDGKGRPGSLGREARKALRSAPVPSGEGSAGVLIWRELAIAAADLVDGARRDGDVKLFLTASRELRTVMPLAMGGGGERGRGRGAEPEPASDDRADDLADVLGSGPEMGDSPEP